MATRKGQTPIEIVRKKLASKLALVEATKDEAYDTAVDAFMSLGYGKKEAAVAATQLQKESLAKLRKEILAEAGLDEDFDEEAGADDAAEAPDDELGSDNVEFEDDMSDGEDEGMEDEDPFAEPGDDMDEDDDLEGPDALVEEEDNEMPGDGEVVDEIEVPGGKLTVTFTPSGEGDLEGGLDEGDDLDGELGGGEDFGPEMEEGEDLESEPEMGMEEEVEPVRGPSRRMPELGKKDFGGLERMPQDKALLAARKAERNKILAGVNAAERRQILAEVLSDNEKPKDIGLGDDTARSGDGRGKPSLKSFRMEDSSEHGVAGPGEDGKTMTLQNSGGNSLKSDPDFLYFDVPSGMGVTSLNENAKGTMKLDGAHGDLASQRVDYVDAPVPSEGGENFAEFETPTQLQTTKQRKVTVASSENNGHDLTLDDVMKDGQLRAAFEYLKENKYASSLFAKNSSKDTLKYKVANKICDAYETNGKEPVRIADCEDCGGKFVLSQSAIHDEYCPGCQATIRKAVQLVKESSNADYGDELCEAGPNSVTGDPNGDGGFKTQGKIGGAPKDKNAKDMGLNEGQYEKAAETAALKKTLAETKYEQSRVAEAYRTAAKMVAHEMINASEMEEQVDQMLGEGMTAEAMRLYGDQAVKLAQRTRKSVVAENSVGMQRTASSGLARNFSVASTDAPVDLTSRLANVFTSVRPEDFGEDGRKKNRR